MLWLTESISLQCDQLMRSLLTMKDRARGGTSSARHVLTRGGRIAGSDAKIAGSGGEQKSRARVRAYSRSTSRTPDIDCNVQNDNEPGMAE